MKARFSLLFLALLSLLLFGSLFFNVRFLLLSQASSGAQTVVSPQNSYIFASPLQAKANDIDSIRLSIFVLDGQGKGVAGKTVSLVLPPDVSLVTVQSTTDTYGKAIFDTKSKVPGTYEVSAKADSMVLGESISIIFTQ